MVRGDRKTRNNIIEHWQNHDRMWIDSKRVASRTAISLFRLSGPTAVSSVGCLRFGLWFPSIAFFIGESLGVRLVWNQ